MLPKPCSSMIWNRLPVDYHPQVMNIFFRSTFSCGTTRQPPTFGNSHSSISACCRVVCHTKPESQRTFSQSVNADMLCSWQKIYEPQQRVFFFVSPRCIKCYYRRIFQEWKHLLCSTKRTNNKKKHKKQWTRWMWWLHRINAYEEPDGLQ